MRSLVSREFDCTLRSSSSLQFQSSSRFFFFFFSSSLGGSGVFYGDDTDDDSSEGRSGVFSLISSSLETVHLMRTIWKVMMTLFEIEDRWVKMR
jgi:hypothetical protein